MSWFKPSREFYIPAGAIKVVPKCGGVEFHLYTNSNGAPCALCFIGKAQKPSWRYRYSSLAAREAAIRRQIDSVVAAAEAKAKRTAERNKPHKWEPGLILVCSWGYEQTNVDFYEVVRVIGKAYVEIEEIGHTVASDNPEGLSSMSCNVMPDPTARTGKLRKVKVQYGSHVSLSSFSSAHVWDGRPRYCSWYA